MRLLGRLKQLWSLSDNLYMDQDPFLERLKLYFEGNKHVSTLSVATLLLLFAIDGKPAGEVVSTEPALALFGLSLLVSLFGVFMGAAIESVARIYEGTPGRLCFAAASLLFLTGVLFTIILPVLF